MNVRQIVRISWVALLLFFAACVIGRGGEGEEVTQVRVNNNLQPPASLTVWMVPRSGARTMLGSVAPAETKMLRFGRNPVAIQYQLVAETTGGVTIASRPVSLSGVALLDWNLHSNTVQIIDQR